MKNIALVLVLILAGLAGFIATRPSEFLIVRSRTMAAPPEVVHAYVNDFHKWVEWSPWEKVDPALKRQYEGPKAGTGAVYAWQGNKDVGEGRMTITESRPGEAVRIKLEFFKPFAAVNDTVFSFKPSAGGANEGTTVTWTMSGQNNFIAKAMCLFVDMDKMVGGMFEQGLAQMKTVVERRP